MNESSRQRERERTRCARENNKKKETKEGLNQELEETEGRNGEGVRRGLTVKKKVRRKKMKLREGENECIKERKAGGRKDVRT